MKKLQLILFILSVSFFVNAQSFTGQWAGVLKVPGAQLRIVFNINKSDKGYNSTMDSPDQGAKDIPVTSTTVDHFNIGLTISNAGIQYDGTLSDDSIITGILKQSGQSFPLNLYRVKIMNEKAAEVKDSTIVESEIILDTKTGQIFGTLTIPKSFLKIPLALIIAGSGPTDRNGNNPVMKNDAYKKIAAELAKNNIASVRYDKRGIAGSKVSGKNEKDLRFDDYINDAKDWIEFIRKDSRFSTVIVIGHSEGSLIGMIAASLADKFVSVAGAGRPADVVLKEQLGKQPEELQDQAFPVIDSLKKGRTVENVNQELNVLFRISVQPYLISWFKYDPLVEIQKLKIPVLIIQGTNDIQITVEDARLLLKSGRTSELVLIDNMNHVLRKVKGDRQENIATYNNSALPLDDQLIETIIKFILADK